MVPSVRIESNVNKCLTNKVTAHTIPRIVCFPGGRWACNTVRKYKYVGSYDRKIARNRASRVGGSRCVYDTVAVPGNLVIMRSSSGGHKVKQR